MTDNFWRCQYCNKLTRETLNHHCPEKEGKIVANDILQKVGINPETFESIPATMEQPKPVKNDNSRIVLDRVIADLKARGSEGEKKYGSPLTTNNGRDALLDAYQESLDLCQYLAQKIMESEDEV